VTLRVDLGAPVALDGIAITRPDVLAIATGKTGTDDHAKTGPTRSAGETVDVSADGRAWQPLATIAAPALRDDLTGDGRTVRYVRIRSGSDAAAKHPLVVGEVEVRAR